MWQAYNDGKQQHLCFAEPGARGGTQLEVERLKGYGTIKCLGTTALDNYPLHKNIPYVECLGRVFFKVI